MDRVFRIIKREKMAEILDEISRRLRLPLAVMDGEGRPLLSVGDASFCSSDLCPPGSAASTHPLYYNGDLVGSLATSASAEKLEAAAFCVENSLRLEAENIDLTAEVVRVYEEQALIYSLSSKIASEMEVDIICKQVLEEEGNILAVHNVSIMLLDQATNELSTRHCKGRDSEAMAQFRADSSTGLLGRIFQQGEPVTICDVGTEGQQPFPYPVRSILCIPLMTDGKGIGMLVASDKLSGEEFWSQEIKLMAVFAMEVAASIKKAQLYEEISEMFIHTVEALASAIDAKDPYTYGHSNRVARVSVAICNEMGMSRKEVRQVELAAILHDIGKIGTPESILQKPGRLTHKEMEIIHEHPEKGAHILSNIIEFRDVIKWIRHHHEWYDGHGYPDKIAADEIPLQARIITIADTFDAMTSNRPYRKGMPEGKAIRLMEEYTGSQFDPLILKTFKAIYTSGKLSPHLAFNRDSASCAESEFT
jgi:putative nucleotidyltransferase with HDIG domain